MRDRLYDDGIHAEIHGENLAGGFGLLPGYVSVWVPETQSLDADHVLESFRPDEPESVPDQDMSSLDGAAPA